MTPMGEQKRVPAAFEELPDTTYESAFSIMPYTCTSPRSYFHATVLAMRFRSTRDELATVAWNGRGCNSQPHFYFAEMDSALSHHEE